MIFLDLCFPVRNEDIISYLSCSIFSAFLCPTALFKNVFAATSPNPQLVNKCLASFFNDLCLIRVNAEHLFAWFRYSEAHFVLRFSKLKLVQKRFNKFLAWDGTGELVLQGNRIHNSYSSVSSFMNQKC